MLLSCLQLKSPPLFLRLLQRQHRLIGVRHEFVPLHCCRSCLTVHVGLLCNDGGGGALDALARMHLWNGGVDYGHGTGHGVGSYLSVHEGPQRISKPGGAFPGTETELREGMILSNEPGYYKAGAYGIRIENLVLVVPAGIESEGDWGYDAEEGEWCHLLERGIMDPAKVTRAAVENAASVAAMVLTTESLITDVPEKDSPAAPAMPPMDY